MGVAVRGCEHAGALPPLPKGLPAGHSPAAIQPALRTLLPPPGPTAWTPAPSLAPLRQRPLPLSLCLCPSVRPLRLRALQQEARPAARAPEAGSFPPEGECGGPCTSPRARFSHAAFPVPDTQQVRAQEHTPGARRLRARPGGRVLVARVGAGRPQQALASPQAQPLAAPPPEGKERLINQLLWATKQNKSHYSN